MSKATRKTILKKDQRQDDGGSQLKTGVTAKSGDKGKFIVHNSGSAVELLPPEVLELIFKNVESPKDLLSCRKTTGATSAWATALRTTDFYFKMTLPFIMSHLERNDLLNCSSVSKCWNATVDACIQSAEDFDSDQRLNYYQRIVNKLKSGRLPQFIRRFGLDSVDSEDKVAVSPLPFRRVHINACLHRPAIGRRERANQQLFFPNETPLSFVRSNLIKCLAHHGHLIQHLELTLDERNDGPAAGSCQKKLNLIRLCLQRTPNLRVLHISAEEGTMAEFQVSHSKYKWPPLGHLKVLKFADLTNRTAFASIANAYAPQLVQLRFGFKLRKPHRPLSNQFSCLQKIKYLFHEAEDGMEFAAFIQANQCPLKHLTVVFDWPDEVDLSLENALGLTNAANAASDTLETLKFYSEASCRIGTNFDITKFKGLRLPKLKKLDLNDFGYPSLEILQSVCPALETLRVRPGLPRDLCPKMIKAGGMYSKLYSQHNFWSGLGDIERVNVMYTVGPKTVVVTGKRKGVQIKKEIGGGRVLKVYTRRAYDAKVKKKRVMGINGEENQSSSEEEEVFLKPCFLKFPHSGRRRKNRNRQT